MQQKAFYLLIVNQRHGFLICSLLEPRKSLAMANSDLDLELKKVYAIAAAIVYKDLENLEQNQLSKLKEANIFAIIRFQRIRNKIINRTRKIFSQPLGYSLWTILTRSVKTTMK